MSDAVTKQVSCWLSYKDRFLNRFAPKRMHEEVLHSLIEIEDGVDGQILLVWRTTFDSIQSGMP